MNKRLISNKKSGVNLLRVICFWAFFLFAAAAPFCADDSVNAAQAGISVKEINYINSTITLQTYNNDTVFYFSDSSKKEWKTIPGQADGNKTITMDISWVSDTKNYSIFFKGNISTEPIPITIPKKETRFKATFNKLKGTVIFSNAGNRTIEWRKKDSTIWRIVNQNTLPTELSYYFTNGAQLCYRLAPVNGTGITDPGLRASNEVTVTITKKAPAPALTVNGSKFSIAVKKGMAYRKLNSDGTMTEWININGISELMLSSVAPETLYSYTGTRKEATLQFRVNASSTNQVSNIKTLTIPVQKPAPGADTYGISINYTSSTTLALTVRAASVSMPFEYTVIPKGKGLNYQAAAWKTISSSSAVSISSKSAPAGSHIYVRQKSVEASDTVSFSLASVETDITGSNGTEYPPAVCATQLTTLVSTSGVCRIGSPSSYLTFYLYGSTQATVTAIDFYDAYGSNKGSVTCSSSVSRNADSIGLNDKYVITTRITSTDNINGITGEVLYAYITLSNQEVIKSTSTAGVQLYLYPRTVVNNPATSDYSKDFKRIYMSNDVNDATSFKFRLDFGTDKVIDPSGINKFTSAATEVNTLKYSGYTLVKDTDYTVEYGSYVRNDGTQVATATVTVNAANMEKAPVIKSTNEALPLAVYLNNGETIDDSIFITMVSTAVIDDIPIAWAITEGSLSEKTTSTVTNQDGSTSTVTQEDFTVIYLTLFLDTYDVSVANVTWGGVTIFGSASVSKGKATIYLSNAKINKLDVASSETKNIVITLSNGYVISSGCKLTIINSD